MRWIVIRVFVTVAALAATADPARAGFTLQIEPSAPTVAVGGTVDFAVYLAEDVGGTTLQTLGLSTAGVRVTIDSGSFGFVGSPEALIAPGARLPEVIDRTAAPSGATLFVGAPFGAGNAAKPDSSNRILLGTFTATRLTDAEASVAVAQLDEFAPYFWTGGVVTEETDSGGNHYLSENADTMLPLNPTGSSVTFEALDGPGAVSTPAPGGLVLLASGLFPLIGYARWRRARPARRSR